MAVSEIDRDRQGDASNTSEPVSSVDAQPPSRGGFSPGAVVLVEELSQGADWEVKKAFSYTGKKKDVFYVEEGMRTDFASVPRVFVVPATLWRLHAGRHPA